MFYISIVEFLRYSHLCEIRKNNFISKNLYKKLFSIKFPTSPLLCRNYPIFLFNFPTSFVNTKKIHFQLLAKHCWFWSNQSNSGMLEILKSDLFLLFPLHYGDEVLYTWKVNSINFMPSYAPSLYPGLESLYPVVLLYSDWPGFISFYLF